MSQVLKVGVSGEEVKVLQAKLEALGFRVKPDGSFGPATKEAVEELQAIFGYTIDGLVGPGTSKLIDAQTGFGWSLSVAHAMKRGLEAQGNKTEQGGLIGAVLGRTLKRGFEGTDVRYLQRRLSELGFQLVVDAKFGDDTERAVRELQKAFGYTVDGVVGEATNKLINQQLGYDWNVAKATLPGNA